MNLNDNRLIIKTLKSGDQKVFSLVYASYYKPLCLFCSSYVSLEEAEEIVQDLMMYVWEKRELLVEDLSLKSFLFTSVRNRALNSITRSHITRQVYEEYQSQQLKSLPALDSCYSTELFNAYMEQFLADNHVSLNPEFELATSEMIVQFALRNLGVGCVVKDFAREYMEEGTLFELRFNKMIPKRQFCIVRNQKNPLSAAAGKLLEIIYANSP